MRLTAPERETVITMNDEDELAHIWTAQRRTITKLKKNPAAALLEEGRVGTSACARFTLPKAFVSFRSKARTRTRTPALTSGERAEIGERLRGGQARPRNGASKLVSVHSEQ